MAVKQTGTRLKETQTANPVLWFEVMGKDGKGLRRFYRELFGWQITEGEVNAPFDYGLVARGPKGVPGGIGSGSDGSTSFATFYVEVDNPSAFLPKAEKLGGRTVMPAVEIPEMHLTFAYFADPEGHVIGLSNGVGSDGQRGSSANPVLSFEVMGKDAKALRRFYADLFGWKMSAAASPAFYDYRIVDTGGEGAIGGIGPSNAGGLDLGSGFATFKVEVDDATAVLRRAEALGGKTVISARVIPDTNLTIAYFVDPEGHVIGLTQGVANL